MHGELRDWLYDASFDMWLHIRDAAFPSSQHHHIFEHQAAQRKKNMTRMSETPKSCISSVCLMSFHHCSGRDS